eukprot:GHVU01024005.1.p1 GENE.GHVU01024005.1~~GHVU01024005.1.p1  ORF type:complete len:200 (-),score=11.00 GHVU01024005.1:126-725(-)
MCGHSGPSATCFPLSPPSFCYLPPSFSPHSATWSYSSSVAVRRGMGWVRFPAATATTAATTTTNGVASRASLARGGPRRSRRQAGRGSAASLLVARGQPAESLIESASSGRWQRCFHGTGPIAVRRILEEGRLRPSDGFNVRARKGHLANRRYLYTSPSLAYAGLGLYATPFEVRTQGPSCPVCPVLSEARRCRCLWSE